MIKRLFSLFCYIYSQVFTNFENFYYKKKNKLNAFEQKGFIKINKILNESVKLNSYETYNANKYLKKFIFTEEKIIQIVNEIFIKTNLKKNLTEFTGYNYSIDYITAYETFPIKEVDKSEGWYANKLHIDKPFSENTIKLIIPLQEIRNDNGPMKIADIKLSKKIFLKNNYNDDDLCSFCGDTRDIFIFKPRLCYHTAGVPVQNKTRKQLMLQLNPSKKWKFNKKIFLYQKKREPKFPFFTYILDKRKEL